MKIWSSKVFFISVFILINSCSNEDNTNKLVNTWVLANKFIKNTPVSIYYKVNKSKLNKLYINDNHTYCIKEYNEIQKESTKNGVWAWEKGDNCKKFTLNSGDICLSFVIIKLNNDSLEIRDENNEVHLIFLRESSVICNKFEDEIDKLYNESL